MLRAAPTSFVIAPLSSSCTVPRFSNSKRVYSTPEQQKRLKNNMVSSWGRTIFLVFVYCALAALAGGTISDSTQEQQLSLLIRRNVDTTRDEMKSLGSAPYGGETLQSSKGVANEWSDAWTGSNDNSNILSWRHCNLHQRSRNGRSQR